MDLPKQRRLKCVIGGQYLCASKSARIFREALKKWGSLDFLRLCFPEKKEEEEEKKFRIRKKGESISAFKTSIVYGHYTVRLVVNVLIGNSS